MLANADVPSQQQADSLTVSKRPVYRDSQRCVQGGETRCKTRVDLDGLKLERKQFAIVVSNLDEGCRTNHEFRRGDFNHLFSTRDNSLSVNGSLLVD